jgi:hypothetical protein
METPLHAWFAPKATGSTQTITNASDKDVWLGMPVPLNMVVPAGAGLGGKPPFTFELAIYRAKDDQRDTSQDIGVKYWSTDAARCKVGARKPGPTTPDEFGPPFPVPPQDIQ